VIEGDDKLKFGTHLQLTIFGVAKQTQAKQNKHWEAAKLRTSEHIRKRRTEKEES
jgi:hypothetical protein